MNLLTHGWTDGKTDRKTDRQTDRHIHTEVVSTEYQGRLFTSRRQSDAIEMRSVFSSTKHHAYVEHMLSFLQALLPRIYVVDLCVSVCLCVGGWRGGGGGEARIQVVLHS